MNVKTLLTLVLLSATATTALAADCSGRMLKGKATPVGHPSWDLEIDFDTGKATHSNSEGAKATRQVGVQACTDGLITFTLSAGTPTGVPDLTCSGVITGTTTKGHCIASGGHPEEKFDATLTKKNK